MKTAALMAVSCEAGALAAVAGPRDVEKMRDFGINLGCAFQIADDIDDLEGAARENKFSGAMREKARDLIMKAKKTLTPFGKKAEKLIYLTDIVLERTRKSGKHPG